MRSTLGPALRLLALASLAAGCIDVEIDASALVTSALSPAEETETFWFQGAEGDLVTIRIVSRKPNAIDFDVALRDEIGAQVGFAGAPGLSDVPGNWSVTGFPLPSSGRFGFEVSGDRVGEYQMQVKVGKGSKRTQRLDLRPASLARPGGGETAVSRTVQPSGGVVRVENGHDDLVGAGVTLPAGALKKATRILIASAATPVLPAPTDPVGSRAAGPAMRIDPPLRLATPVTVDVRYLLADLPAGADPAAIRVFFVGPDGKWSAITPIAVNEASSVVTVTTDRFGTFLPVIARGVPNLAGKTYWETAFVLGHERDKVNDSRVRTLWAVHGRRMFQPNGQLTFSEYQTWLDWTHDDEGRATLHNSSSFDSGNMSWTLSPDGRRVSVSDSEAERYALGPSEDASFLVPYLSGGASESSNWLGVSVEIDEEDPTPEYVAGTYWTAAVVFNVSRNFEGGPAALEIGRQLGTLTLRADGTWSSAVDYHAGRADGDGPARDAGGALKSGGTWLIAPADENHEFRGSIRLLDGNGARVIGSGLRFGAKGRAFVALQEPLEPGVPLVWVIGVRKERSSGPALLRGEYAVGEFRMAHTAYDVPSRAVADLTTTMATGTVSFADRAVSALPGSMERNVLRDSGSPGGVLVFYLEYEGMDPVRCTLQKTGRLVVDPHDSGLVGAMTADSEFGFHVSVSRGPGDPFGISLYVRSAPK